MHKNGATKTVSVTDSADPTQNTTVALNTINHVMVINNTNQVSQVMNLDLNSVVLQRQQLLNQQQITFAQGAQPATNAVANAPANPNTVTDNETGSPLIVNGMLR